MSPDPTPPPEPSPDTAAPAGPEEPTRVRPDGGDGPATPPRAAPPDPAAGLLRSSSDRVLFGVCGGVAERYGFEPLLVRLAFVGTLLIGGAGALFYLAAALLIPPAPPEAAAPGRESGPAVAAAGGVLRVLVGLAALIAILAGVCTVAVVSLGLTAFFGAWPVAVLLLLLGALLVVSARTPRTTGALLVLALALAVPATGAVVADVDIDGSVGQRDVRPASATRAQGGYRLGVGQLVVDLRRLPLRDGQTLRIPARVDVGQLGVVLPAGRCVAWTVRTRMAAAGVVDVLSTGPDDHVWEGGGSHRDVVEIDPPRRASDRRPRVTLDLRGGVGQLVVARTRREIDAGVADGEPGLSGGDDVLRTRACRAEDRR